MPLLRASFSNAANNSFLMLNVRVTVMALDTDSNFYPTTMVLSNIMKNLQGNP